MSSWVQSGTTLKGLLALFLISTLVSCKRGKNGDTLNQTSDQSVVQSSVNPGEPPPVNLLSYEQRQGKHLYKKYCTVCHGEEGKGDGFNAFNLDPRPRDFTDVRYMSTLSDVRLLETISEGGRGVNKSPLMPSWGGRLSKQEIEYIAAYVNFLRQKK